MVTPEIDWWIKNVTQVKEPVYNKKIYLQLVAGKITFKVNQNKNIRVVIFTDLVIKPDNAGCTVADDANGMTLFVLPGFGMSSTPIVIPNIYYIVESENISLTVSGAATFASAGIITVSAKT